MRHCLTCVLAVVATVLGIVSVANTASAAGTAPATSTRPWKAQAHNLRAVVSSPDRIRLSWSNPTQSDFAGMIIRRNGHTVAQTASQVTSYLDHGLVPERTYSYSLVATNSARRHGLATEVIARTSRSVVAAKPRPAAASATRNNATPSLTAGSIHGTVIGAGNHPLGDVDVVVYDPDGNYITDDFTGSDGTYEIDGLTPDTSTGYTVCFYGFYANGGTSSTGYASQCNAGVPWNGSYNTPPAGVTPVPVAAGTDPEVDVTLNAGAALSGTVRQAAGAKQPLADVNVIVFDGAGDSPISATTETNGKYRVNGLLPGSYYVCFDASGADGGSSSTGYTSQRFRTANFDGFDVPTGANAVSVTAGSAHVNVNGNLPAAGEIAGTVTAAQNGAPLDGFNVLAFDGTGNVVSAGLASDPGTGAYQLTGLPASKTGYTVCFDGSTASGGPSFGGYLDQCWKNVAWDGSDIPGGTTAVPVSAGQTASGIDAHLGSAGAIRGTVTSATGGTGVNSVDVEAFVDDNFAAATLTASDGSYTISGLMPGESYAVCFDTFDAAGGGSTTGYVPQCFDGVAWDGNGSVPPSDATSVPVAAGARSDNIDAQLASAGAISGSVTANSNGSGIADVDAVVLDTSGNEITDVATGSNGKYRINGLAPGSYTVCFQTTLAQGGPSTTGYRSQCYNNKPWGGQFDDFPANATAVSVTSSSVHANVNAKLLVGGEIAGTVTASADGQPLEDVTVDVFTADGNPVTDGFTDVDGTYQIRGLAASPSGGYRVCFDATDASGGTSVGGYLDQCYNDVAWDGFDVPADAATVSVSVGSSTEVDAALDDGGAIAGTVTSAAHGTGIDDVRVEAYDDTTGEFVNGTFSDSDGSYQVNGLPAGSYAVCFDPFDASGGGVGAGYVPQCYNDVAWDEIDVPTDAQPVSVSMNAVAGPVDAALSSAGAISGTVTAQSGGAPLENVDVVVITGDGSYITDQFTISSGKYDITGLAPSTSGYYVCFDASQATGGTAIAGYRSQCWNNQAWSPGAVVPSGATAVKVTAGATHSGIGAKLLSGSGIAGTVTSASDSTPVADAQIEILDSSSNFVASTATGLDGTYQVIGLTAPPAGFVVCFVGPDDPAPPTGYADQCYKNQPWNGAAYVASGVTKVHTQVNTIRDGIDAALTAGAAITGTVTSAATHSGVSGGFVGVFSNHGFVAGTGTAAHGVYTISGLTPGAGPYFVCFSGGGVLHGTPTGLAPQCYNGTSTGAPWDGSDQAIPAGAMGVTVINGGTAGGIDAALAAGGAIAGVIQANGSPVTDGLVQVFDSAGNEVGESGTIANGSYKAYGLLPASYTVCFSAPGEDLQPQCYNGVAWDGTAGDLPSGTTPVTVHAGTVKNNINATLPA